MADTFVLDVVQPDGQVLSTDVEWLSIPAATRASRMSRRPGGGTTG